MPLIVQPRGGLTIAPSSSPMPPPPAPGSSPTVGTGLPLELRAQALDQFFQRVVVALALDGERLQIAERTVERLPAVGMLIVPDWVASLDQLAPLDWLQVWEDVQLPRPMLPAPLQAAGAAPPWHLGLINRPSGPGSPSGAQVSIGVIDFGYEPTFPDLGSFSPLYAEYVDANQATNTAGGMILGLTPHDNAIKHGSLVCVMLAGTSCGVAPNASFFVARIEAASFGGTQAKMVSALNWLLSVQPGAHPARTHGCDIITTSLFTGAPNAIAQGTPIEAALNVVEAANTLMIAAVGNDGPGKISPPGSLPKVVAVGAVDKQRNVASFSGDRNPSKPDILAPGKGVQVPDGSTGHQVIDGTSFAAPIVAGAAALILEEDPSLRFNVVQFRNTVLGFVSPPPTNVGLQVQKGICDLQNL